MKGFGEQLSKWSEFNLDAKPAFIAYTDMPDDTVIQLRSAYDPVGAHFLLFTMDSRILEDADYRDRVRKAMNDQVIDGWAKKCDITLAELVLMYFLAAYEYGHVDFVDESVIPSMDISYLGGDWRSSALWLRVECIVEEWQQVESVEV